jgi:hypothetical protein
LLKNQQILRDIYNVNFKVFPLLLQKRNKVLLLLLWKRKSLLVFTLGISFFPSGNTTFGQKQVYGKQEYSVPLNYYNKQHLDFAHTP